LPAVLKQGDATLSGDPLKKALQKIHRLLFKKAPRDTDAGILWPKDLQIEIVQRIPRYRANFIDAGCNGQAHCLARPKPVEKVFVGHLFRVVFCLEDLGDDDDLFFFEFIGGEHRKKRHVEHCLTGFLPVICRHGAVDARR
jgi:hypothetical protein